jgi:hypothetical protein
MLAHLQQQMQQLQNESAELQKRMASLLRKERHWMIHFTKRWVMSTTYWDCIGFRYDIARCILSNIHWNGSYFQDILCNPVNWLDYKECLGSRTHFNGYSMGCNHVHRLKEMTVRSDLFSLCSQYNLFVGLCVFGSRFINNLRIHNIIDFKQPQSLYKLLKAGSTLLTKSKLSTITLDSLKLPLPFLIGSFLVIQEDKEIKWSKVGIGINILYPQTWT